MSVVMSSTIPSSTLKKRWNALSYHRVREAVAAGIINVVHLSGDENPADFLTKVLSHTKAFKCWSLSFYSGTMIRLILTKMRGGSKERMIEVG